MELQPTKGGVAIKAIIDLEDENRLLVDPMRGKPCRSGQGQERGRQSRPGGLDWF